MLFLYNKIGLYSIKLGPPKEICPPFKKKLIPQEKHNPHNEYSARLMRTRPTHMEIGYPKINVIFLSICTLHKEKWLLPKGDFGPLQGETRPSSNIRPPQVKWSSTNLKLL
jgi:hypothetical protein